MSIRVFTTSGCGQCVGVKKGLQTKGYDFEEVHVTDDETRNMLKSHGFMNFPVVNFEGDFDGLTLGRDEAFKKVLSMPNL